MSGTDPRTAAIETFLGMFGKVTVGELRMWVLALEPYHGDLEEVFAIWLRSRTSKPMPHHICRLLTDDQLKRPLVRIVQAVSISSGISVEHIMGKKRQRHIVEARHEAVFQMRQRNLSFPYIGRFMNMDQSSIQHAVKRHIEKSGGLNATDNLQ